MSVRFYMDVRIHGAITRGLRARGVDVLTAQEDHSATLEDNDLLDRATSLGRVLVSMDSDLRREAVLRQRAGIPFAGVIVADELCVTIGQCVGDLELIAKAGNPDDLANQLQYLPL